jgi:hypothetical protein
LNLMRVMPSQGAAPRGAFSKLSQAVPHTCRTAFFIPQSEFHTPHSFRRPAKERAPLSTFTSTFHFIP